MTDRDKALKALTELRPPAADPFTYLAAVEEYISPDILPEFNEILQDVELTSLIGWDLVDKLVVLDGCEPCLETIARLGNPREVIIKVLEVLEQMQRGVLGIAGGETLEEYEEESDDEDADTADKGSGVTADAAAAAADYTRRFIILTGMLSILHQRLRTRHPSRFLAPSLSAVFTAYASPGAPGPSDQTTAAVINLVHTLSGRCRPALPSRRSSVDVAHPGMDRDAARRNAPDPEGQEGATGTPDGTGPVAGEGNSDPVEEAMQTRLLLSFVTFVLEAYVNEKGLAWSPRLYEHLNAEAATKLGRTTLMEYREDEGLLARDSIVGKLVVSGQRF